jgi:C4-dicarboxylate-specific signal transduction histidine kinase
VLAVLLWVVIAVVAVCLLGVVCSRILRARSRLEPLQPADPELHKRVTAKTQEMDALYTRRPRDNTIGWGG